MIRRLRPWAGALALPLAFLVVGTAVAQTAGLDVRIREVSFTPEGETQLTVSVSGPSVPATGVAPESFTVTEQGTPVTGLRVEEFFERGTQAVAVALLVDVSQSTLDRLDAAKAAAKEFIAGLPAQVRVSLTSFGATVERVRDFTVLGSLGSAERGAVEASIDGLAVDGTPGTKLYDAIDTAGAELRRQVNAQTNVVMFSDGGDKGSTATEAQALTSLSSAEAVTTAVLLSTADSDRRALQAVADEVQGGALVPVTDPAALTAAFARVAQAISNQYVLTYPASSTENADLTLAVSVAVGTASVEDRVAVANLREEAREAPTATVRGPLIPFLTGTVGFLVAILALFAAIGLFLGMILYAPAGKRAERLLQRGLRMYSRSGRDKAKTKQQQKDEGGMFAGTAVGRAAVDLLGRLPRPKKFDENMQAALDQAGWPLRSTEFILIQIGAVIAGILVGFVLFGSTVFGILMTVVGAIAPRLALTNTIQRRETTFLAQLPDTLQLLAGSLQAGYGFLQAIDTVAKETDPPTSVEFSRVLAEARLGMPLEDALEGMAERVGGEDFKWVVLAINIQRQVGGNLATLLTTVADTLREREMVRRQIKVLSAEGRLSAIILSGLPFVLVGYLSVVSPTYLSELTSATAGKVAIVVALVLMGAGIVWMRKIIKIDV